MANNKWTTGAPITGQTVRAVLAERVYIAPDLTVFADPSARISTLANGDPASPWQDLGIVAGSKVTIEYTKDVQYVETGIDKYVRGAYLTGKKAKATFALEQFDIGVLVLATGIGSDVCSPAMSPAPLALKMHIGQEDVVKRALLFTAINKVDDKEFYTYAKSASLSFQIGEQDAARVLNVTADFFPFTPSGETVEALFTLYIVALV